MVHAHVFGLIRRVYGLFGCVCCVSSGGCGVPSAGGWSLGLAPSPPIADVCVGSVDLFETRKAEQLESRMRSLPKAERKHANGETRQFSHKAGVRACACACRRVPVCFTSWQKACACAQWPWLAASVWLRLARLPPPASRVRRSRRLRDTLAAAPGLLAHTSVTEII
jgi:hypothetical protein